MVLASLIKLISMVNFNWKYKLSCFSLFMIAHTIFYTYSNLYPWFQPLFLPLLALDYRVPLIPWTFLIYVSDYVLFVLIICLHKDKQQFNSMVRMCFVILVVCGMFFIIYPTTYPRPPYPKSGNFLVSSIMHIIGSADTPHNCLPSLHVCLTGVAVWSIRAFGWRKFLPFWIWAVAIFISTLTTKQHYFVDVVGGIALIAAVALVEWALFEKRALVLAFKKT